MIKSLNYRIDLNTVLFLSLLVGLFGSVTNVIFLSPLPSILFIGLLPWVLYKENVVVLPKFIFYLYIFFVYSLISTVLYEPQSLISFSFYRYDGNFIISYAPLLSIAIFKYEFNLSKVFKRFLAFSTVVNTVAFILNIIFNHFSFNWDDPATYFHGLFKSTNAAGGFLSIIITLNIIILFREYKRKWFLSLLINLLFLFATTSRGSLLGLLIGFLFFYLNYKKYYFGIWFIITAICLLQAIILVFTYPIFDEYIRNADLTDTSVGEYITPIFGQISTKSSNLLIRVIDTWPRGLDNFINSPILGTGFGAVNDVPLQYKGIPYIFSFNSQPIKVFNDAHAHHSYLHILGEEGIVGFGIFILFWLNLYKFLQNQPESFIRNFLLVSYFNLTIMSFTEHRITSPSNSLPFVISLCLYYMYIKREESLQSYK